MRNEACAPSGQAINHGSGPLKEEVGFPTETGWFERCFVPT